MFREALAIREAVLEVNDKDTATSYNDIGGVLQRKCNYDET